MQAFLAIMRSLGVLLVVWGALGAIAWIAGVVPTGASSHEEDVADSERIERDGGIPRTEVRADDASTSNEDASIGDRPGEAVVEPPEDLAAHAVEPTRRYAVCETMADASFGVVDVVRNRQKELVVGCGREAHVLVPDSTGAETSRLPVPRRVAIIAVPEESSLRAHLGAAEAGDVDGDGQRDLLLPLVNFSPERAPRSGQVYWLRGRSDGSFEGPTSMADLPASAVVVTRLDHDDRDDIAVVRFGNVYAQEASQLVVFRGGTRPFEVARPEVGMVGVAVGAADLDQDGFVDLVGAAADDSRIRVFFGDARLRFSRSQDFESAGATHVVTGDINGDGRVDVVVSGGEIRVLYAGTNPLGAELVPGPRGLSIQQVVDHDRDGRLDLVGVLGNRVIVLRQSAPGAFEEITLALMDQAPVRPLEVAISDLDLNGHQELVILGRSMQERDVWEIIVADIEVHGDLRLTERAVPLSDAPLLLRLGE